MPNSKQPTNKMHDDTIDSVPEVTTANLHYTNESK
jgi:hypothetical protein